MPNPHNLQVGQTVWLERYYSRRKPNPIKTKVSKINRLTFLVEDAFGRRFNLETLQHNVGVNSRTCRVWLSLEAYENFCKRSELADQLFLFVDWYNLPLEKLEAVHRLLVEDDQS